MALVRPTRQTLLAALAATLAVVLGGCGSQTEGGGGATDVPPEHVHGLGLNPADGSLYIATHTGLFRMERGSDRSERVGGSLQDTMGFAVAGPDRFLGSGHPDLRDDLPPLLGLIRSDDAGETWEPVSLAGDADFHALRVRGTRVVGYDAANVRLMLSDDSGATWRSVRPPAELGDLVVDPGDSRRLVATSAAGLLRSDDAGRRWSQLPGSGAVLAWPVSDALYGLTAAGRVEVSRDGGTTWTAAGDVGGEPAAATATGRDALIVALHDGRIRSSDDGGASWTDGAWPAGA